MRAVIWALLRLVFFLPLWCLGLIVLALGLALSPWGTGLLLEEGAKRGFYQLEESEGAVLDHLVLHELRLEAGPATVALDRLELAWADDCLLSGRLCIDRLAVEGARIRLADGEASPGEPDGESGPRGEFRLQFPVELRSLSLSDVEVRLADGTRIEVDQFTSAAEAQDSRVTLEPTRLTGLRVALPDSPGTRLALEADAMDGPRLTAPTIDAALDVRSPPDAPAVPLAERERLTLPEVELPMAISAPEVVVEDIALSGPVDYAIRRLALSLEASGHRVEIEPLEIATLDTDARLTAEVELRDDYPLEARLEAALWLPELMPELAGQRLDLALSGSLAELEVDLTASGPVDARLTGRVDVLDPALPFTASLDSELLQWPLPTRLTTELPEQGEALPDTAYVAEDVAVRLEGSLLDYRAALTMQLEGGEIPRTRVALSGSGDFEHFAWTPLSLSLGRASVVSRGRVDWVDGLDVDAELRLDNVDPGRFTDAVEGQLSGDVELSFSQSEGAWALEVPQLDIEGELQSRPLSLEARLAGNSDMEWRIDELDFRQGRNRLTASGQVSDTLLDLRGEFDLPALASLHDELQGALSGNFATGGSLQSPELDLQLRGDDLAFADNRVERLRLEGSARGLDDPALDMSLDLEGVEAGGQRFREVTGSLGGRLSDHRLELEAIAGPGMPLSRASLEVAGRLSEDRQRYSASVTSLEGDTEYGDMRLDEALDLAYDLEGGNLEVTPFCVRREQGGRVCFDEGLRGGAQQGSMSMTLRELPMALLEAWLPETWSLAGETELDLRAEWSRGGSAWRLQADLASELTVQGRDAYGQPWTLPNTRLTAEVDANQASIELDVSLQLAESGRVGLALSVEEPLGAGRLDGSLTLDALQLSRYRTLVTDVETLDGTLNGSVQIGGNRDAPQLDGALELTGLQASGADVPVVVQDGRIRVEFNGDSARLMGYVASDEGRLVLDGEAAWPSPDDWQIAVDVDGTRRPLLIVMPEFGRLRVAPDVSVRIDPERLQVRGSVQVPWARLEVGEAPEAAVSPSPDEVIITEREDARARRAAERGELDETVGAGSEAAAALNETGMAIDVQIDLTLGPDMLLEAYGLNASLFGNLEVRQQNGPVQLFGDVNLQDGRFRAFGQDLLIRQGQLLFSGPPDQPLLDFEAIRNPDITEDDVIAGLRVTGSASAPQLEVFSEPAMEEARALSYLLRGRAPDAAGGDTGQALTSALIGMTLGQTGGAVGAVGEAFGISDLGLEAAGTGEESQVVVSGQLTEDLRVSYGVGIFTPIAELTLRYTLWRNLYVEAVSGAAQAVDLIYTFSLPGKPPQLD